MRIALLSAGTGWHVRDLQRAAVLLNHEAVVVDFRRIHAGVGTDADSLDTFDGVVVRTMPPGSLEQVIFRMDVLHRLQETGVAVLNPPRAVEICVDKYLTTARLAAAGLPVPPTCVCQHADAALEAFRTLGGDIILKPLFGSEGRGMLRITDAELAWRTFRTLERLQCVLYLQRYIPHPGWDLRAFVVGGQVIAAMRRRSNGGWRTNVAQGGTAESVRLTAEEENLAVRAAGVVGARVAGVDLLPGPAGELYILEVNAVPGWRALAPLSGVDIAAMVLGSLALC
jgi:ribosomal protein S6--L-glutamate ligase